MPSEHSTVSPIEVVVGGALPLLTLTLLIALLLDVVLPAALVWGGGTCPGPSGLGTICRVAPVGVVVAALLATAVYVPTVSFVVTRWECPDCGSITDGVSR